MKFNTTIIAAISAFAIFSSAAMAGSLENLERERAVAVGTLLDPDLRADERFNKIRRTKSRLIDLERMVMRDKELRGVSTPMVRKAFENYDLTFLVHASIENEVTLLDQWLGQVGLTTDSLMGTRSGNR